MPQDNASCDRKDLLRQRKHERSEQSVGSAFRWRNSSTPFSSCHYFPREYSRWGSGDSRRPPGQGRQDGWHQFAEENGHGYAPSRSNARMFEDDHYRPTTSRGEWRSNRNNRDGRVSFSQRNWKCHTWDVNTGSLSASGRPRDMKNDRWLVDERSSHPSEPHAALLDSWGQANSMHQRVIEVEPLKVNNDQTLVDQGLSLPSDAHSTHIGLSKKPCLEDTHANKVYSPGRQCHDVKCEQRSADDSSLHASNSHADLEGIWGRLCFKDQLENKDGLKIAKGLGRESSLGSIDWKHLIWSRSGSFASRGSSFSHSSNSRGLGVVDSIDQPVEHLPKNVTATKPPSGDPITCSPSSYPSEEMNSRKKPRLGWGEGLAKYEKKKVEVPDLNTNEDGTTLLANSTEGHVEASPTVVGVSDYGSPASPVACSSSPDMEVKSSGKSINAANQLNYICCSPSPVHDSHCDGCPFNSGKLDNISTEKFGWSLDQLLLNDDSGPEHSSFAGLTAMNKVLTWKTDILKALEMTESEIDSLENELRVLKSETGSCCPNLAGSSSNLCVVNANLSHEQEAPYSLSPQQASSVAGTVEKDPVPNGGLYKVPIDVNEGGADGPEAATSKLSEPLPSFKVICLSQFVVSPESNQDSLEKAVSSEVKMPAFANGFLTVKEENGEPSSDGCSMASDGEDTLCAMIFASNRKSAGEACEVFKKLLSREVICVDGSRFFEICQGKADTRVKRKFGMRRRLLNVKERFLVFKFKAFQYSWKKDIRQLSIRKYNLKSQKKFDISLHAKNGGLQKLPYSTRLRFSCPAAGRVNLVPSTDFVNYMGKLLQDSQWKPCKDILRMPALILDEKERSISRFVSSNGLVEDPCAVEKERTLINPWTLEEREIFLNKLAAYGKDFRKIASFLKQKTTADCVDFYYKNHKSDYFKKIKKKLAFGKEQKCTFMSAPQKKWKHEVNVSLDLLGAVSVLAANASKVASNKQMSTKRITLGSCSSSKSHCVNGIKGCLPNFALPHRETVAADVLAGICGSLSSKPVSSCMENAIYTGGKCKAHLKLDPTVKETQISETTHNDDGNDDEDTCSEEIYETTGPIHWTDEERSAFVQAFSLYGKNFSMISQFIGTRSRDQCKVFYSKVRKCLGLEFVRPLSGNVSTSASADNGNDGGGSDMEDPCAVETSSVICNDDLWAKMDADSSTFPFNINEDGAGHSGPVKLETDSNRSGQENGMVYSRWKDNAELVDYSVSLNRDYPVSEVGSGFIDIRAVANQSQASQRTRNDHLVLTGTGVGTSSSIVVSCRPTTSSHPILANIIDESFTEIRRKDSEGRIARGFSQNQDSMMRSTNRTFNHVPQAEAKTSSDFSFSDCLHHVPIKVCMGDPVGVHLSREISSTHSESEPQKSLAVHVAEKNNLDKQSSTVQLQSGEKRGVFSHVDHEQHDSKKLNVSNSESFQIPWSSSTQVPNEGEMTGNIGYEKHKEIKSRSKSDVGITILHAGNGFC